MPRNTNPTVATMGIDIGKNSFHVVGLDWRGAIVVRQKWTRGQIEARLANMPPCLIGMEACVGAHHLSRRLHLLGHDARLMPAKYVRAYSKGQKNDFRDAEAIAEAVQRPTMKFVATKTPEQLDLQALHRVRERLVSQRTGIINQIRAFLLERGIAVRQGLRFLRAELPQVLAKRTDVLSIRMVHVIEDLAGDWRRLDERIEGLSTEIEALARQDRGCKRLMTVPGIGPIISSAMVAAVGNGAVFSKGRDFGAWLGLVPKQISTGDRTILDIHDGPEHTALQREAEYIDARPTSARPTKPLATHGRTIHTGHKNGGADRAIDASGVTLTPDVLGAVRPLRLRATTRHAEC
jgi:transposase